MQGNQDDSSSKAIPIWPEWVCPRAHPVPGLADGARLIPLGTLREAEAERAEAEARRQARLRRKRFLASQPARKAVKAAKARAARFQAAAVKWRAGATERRRSEREAFWRARA
jgi:hypothetical protein